MQGISFSHVTMSRGLRFHARIESLKRATTTGGNCANCPKPLRKSRRCHSMLLLAGREEHQRYYKTFCLPLPSFFFDPQPPSADRDKIVTQLLHFRPTLNDLQATGVSGSKL